MGVKCVVKELEDRSALLSAGGSRGPDALTPGAARRALRALRDAALDDHEAQGLFGQVVGGLDSWRGDEAEVGVGVLAKPIRHVPRRRRPRRVRGGAHNVFALTLQRLAAKDEQRLFPDSLCPVSSTLRRACEGRA